MTTTEIFCEKITQAIIQFNNDKPDNCQFIIDLFKDYEKNKQTPFQLKNVQVSPYYFGESNFPQKNVNFPFPKFISPSS